MQKTINKLLMEYFVIIRSQYFNELFAIFQQIAKIYDLKNYLYFSYRSFIIDYFPTIWRGFFLSHLFILFI